MKEKGGIKREEIQHAMREGAVGGGDAIGMHGDGPTQGCRGQGTRARSAPGTCRTCS